ASAGEMVSREQLIARLWPKRIVDFDSALNAAVRRLRAALDDEAETPHYIETIPRHGYRFIGTILPPIAPKPDPVKETASAASSQLRPHVAWSAVAALACAAIIGIVVWSAHHERVPSSTPGSTRESQGVVKSIAVLPFIDLSATQDQQYF